METKIGVLPAKREQELSHVLIQMAFFYPGVRVQCVRGNFEFLAPTESASECAAFFASITVLN